jgi:hypothetical protein
LPAQMRTWPMEHRGGGRQATPGGERRAASGGRRAAGGGRRAAAVDGGRAK